MIDSFCGCPIPVIPCLTAPLISVRSRIKALCTAPEPSGCLPKICGIAKRILAIPLYILVTLPLIPFVIFSCCFKKYIPTFEKMIGKVFKRALEISENSPHEALIAIKYQIGGRIFTQELITQTHPQGGNRVFCPITNSFDAPFMNLGTAEQGMFHEVRDAAKDPKFETRLERVSYAILFENKSDPRQYQFIARNFYDRSDKINPNRNVRDNNGLFSGLPDSVSTCDWEPWKTSLDRYLAFKEKWATEAQARLVG